MSLEKASRIPSEDIGIEVEIGAKYATMALEDRAFEILKDLGMIEIHEFSTEEKQQNSSDVVDSKESGSVRTENLCDEEDVILARKAEVPQVKNATLSKRQRLFRPLRRVLEISKKKLNGKSAASTTTLADATLFLPEAIDRARRQPKSLSEEAVLAKKYGQLSLEDRAYAILCDLGMIESN